MTVAETSSESSISAQSSSDTNNATASMEHIGKGSRLAWCGFLMCGAGYLVPFNSYISSANFLEQRYEKYRPEFYLPLVYMYVTAPSVALNMVKLVDKFSIISRIRFGFAMLLFSLAFFPVTEALVTSGLLSRESGYIAIVIGVGTTALGGGVQQSTLFGYAGELRILHASIFLAVTERSIKECTFSRST